MSRVIIVGGSVAGLSTALLLEAAGIDFILLEAREIAPAVGASLGLWANGFRILDQLGIYDQILDVTVSGKHQTTHGRDGRVLSDSAASGDDLWLEATGYASAFLDRQKLIQIMYDNLKSKDKVLTQKRIASVDQSEENVTVACTDGSVYTGDLLVGADGVHSSVRSEMWKSMERDDPNLLPPEEKTAITVTFSAMFGIANPVPGVEAGCIYLAHQENSQMMTVGGKDARCYFFIFKRLDRKYKAPDLPKFTAEDRDKLAEFHRTHKVNTTVTFGDIWDRKIIGTYLPLEESAFTWYAYKRIVLVGDAIHKPTPASGQGGNGAIESAAVLVNLIVKAMARHKHCKEGRLSLLDATEISEQYTKMRRARMSELISHSHKMNDFTLLSPVGLAIFEWILPCIPAQLQKKGVEKMLLEPIFGAPYAEFLPLKNRNGIKAWKNQ